MARTLAFVVIAAAALLASRPADAMSGFMSAMMVPYQSPVSKLNVMCGTCHADWGGRETRNDLGVAYQLYSGNLTVTGPFSLLDADHDGVSTTAEFVSSQSAAYPGDTVRWMPAYADKDGDGCIALYSRSDENGMPVPHLVTGSGYVNGNDGFITYGPKGWDIDDNDATVLAANGNRPAGCSTAWPMSATPGTFVTPGVTNDTTAPAQIADLRAASLAATSMPLTWTAVADDGSTGVAAHDYDLRYTTDALASARAICTAGSDVAGSVACRVRDKLNWKRMYDAPDSDIDSSAGMSLGKTGTVATGAGAWNAGVVAPLMRSLYEPLPGAPAATETFTLTTKGVAVTTNVIANDTTYWLAIRASDGMLKPTGTVDAPTGFAENVSPVSNIVAITAGTAGAAIQSYTPVAAINNGTSNTIVATGLGIHDAINAAEMVLTNTAGTVVATGATPTYTGTAGSGTASSVFACGIAAGTYTLELRASGAVTRAAWVDAVTVTNNTCSAGPGTIQFSAATYTVAENGVTATITATRTGGSSGAASVSYATSDGTAANTSDYTITSGTLNWADADAVNKTFTVTINNDTSDETDETVNLTLSGATGATLGAQSTAVLTITDDDTVPALTTPTATVTGGTTATLGATVTSAGTSALTARGTCWATTAAPTTNCVAEGGTATGAFTHARTGLTAGVTYFYRGYATSAVGTAYSADGTFTTWTVPGAPTIGTATGGNASATVAFTAPGSNGGTAITGYTATSSPGGLTGACAASPCTVNGLTNGTAYTFTVTATNSVGTGTASAASNSVTPSTVPGAPTIGTATAGNTTATVAFTAPASNGGSAITGYTATSSPGGFTGACAASPCTVTGLTNGTPYTFTVYATNINGNSTASAASNSVTPSAVAVVPTLTTPTVSAISYTTATLGATITSDGGGALTARGTCWGTSPAPATNCVAEGGTATGVFTQARTGLSSSTFYYYRGYATNSAGTAYSADGTFTTLTPADTTPPTFGGLVYVGDKGSGGTVTLCFDDATDASGLAALPYIIYYNTASPATGGTSLAIADPATAGDAASCGGTAYANKYDFAVATPSNQADGVKRWFTVRAKDSVGNETVNADDRIAIPYDRTLSIGYNMIGIAGELGAGIVNATIFGDDVTSYRTLIWNSVTQGYASSSGNVEEGTGYMFLNSDGVTKVFDNPNCANTGSCGDAVFVAALAGAVQVTLNKKAGGMGGNLVSNPCLTAVTASTAGTLGTGGTVSVVKSDGVTEISYADAVTSGYVSGAVYRWNPGLGNYQSAWSETITSVAEPNKMRPFAAYWVHVSDIANAKYLKFYCDAQ